MERMHMDSVMQYRLMVSFNIFRFWLKVSRTVTRPSNLQTDLFFYFAWQLSLFLFSISHPSNFRVFFVDLWHSNALSTHTHKNNTTSSLSLVTHGFCGTCGCGSRCIFLFAKIQHIKSTYPPTSGAPDVAIIEAGNFSRCFFSSDTSDDVSKCQSPTSRLHQNGFMSLWRMKADVYFNKLNQLLS